MTPGHIGDIVGAAGVVMSGLLGTHFSIKNTGGPRERAFVIKANVMMWVGIGLFLVLLVVLPFPYKYFVWAFFCIAVGIAMIVWNRTQQRIRQEESRDSQIDETP